jgi:hypothetical protein
MAQRWLNVGSGRRVCIALVGKTHFFEFSSLLHWLCKTCKHSHRACHKCRRWTSFVIAEISTAKLWRPRRFHRCRRFFIFDHNICTSSLAINMEWLWRWVCKPVFFHTLWWIFTLQLLLARYTMDTMWTRNTSIRLGAISHTYSLLFIFTHQTCSKQSIMNSNLWGNSIKDHVLLLGM